MNITRRTLLGTIIGAPLGMVAAKTEAEVNPSSTISVSTASFSQRRMKDIAQAAKLYLREFLCGKGIKPNTTPPSGSFLDDSHGYSFIIRHEDHIQGMDFILEVYFRPIAHGLAHFLHKHNESQCRFLNIEVRPHAEGLHFWVAVSQQETPQYYPECLHESWTRFTL